MRLKDQIQYTQANAMSKIKDAIYNLLHLDSFGKIAMLKALQKNPIW